GPIRVALTARRVVVVAAGWLLYVPFAALPAPSRGSEKGGDPLVAGHDIVMLPSASALDALRRSARPRSTHDRELVVFADPVMTGNDPRVAARSRTIATDGAVPSLARLRFA